MSRSDQHHFELASSALLFLLAGLLSDAAPGDERPVPASYSTVQNAIDACRDGDVVIIGLRSVDLEEKNLLREAGVKVYTMREVDVYGAGRIVRSAIRDLAPVDRVHLSFDLDVVDPEVAPGVGTPIRGGLTYREAHLLMELLNEAGIVTSLDVVEVNPILVRGEPAREIVKQIEALEIDLLVLNEIEEFTSRRESFHDPKEQMLRRAQCQILVVKDPDRATALYETLE